MAVLLSKDTAARLINLLGDQQAPALATGSQSKTARPVAPPLRFASPFKVRYSDKAESWIIYIPGRAALIPADPSTDCAVGLDEAEDLPDWYEVDADSGGPLYVWLEASGSDEDNWFDAWSTAQINAGTEAPQEALDAALCFCVADIDADKFTVRQHVTGQVMFRSGQPDDASLEISSADGSPLWQIYGFDKDDTVAKGLQDCLEVDPESGNVWAADGTDQYELLVRVKGSDGSTRQIGYMPIGQSTGEDPDGTSNDGCQHSSFPGSGDAGGGGGGGGGENMGDERTFPGESTAATRDNNEFPGKTGPCW